MVLKFERKFKEFILFLSLELLVLYGSCVTPKPKTKINLGLNSEFNSIQFNQQMFKILNTLGFSQRKFTTLGPLKKNTPALNDTTTK